MEGGKQLIDKCENFSEWYNWIIYEAELVDIRAGVKGFVVYRPWAMKVMKKIVSIYERLLEEKNHLPVLFPLVIPSSNLAKEREHVKGFEDEVFWVTHAGSRKLSERLCLRPTSETIIYPLFSLWIRSYKDLPLKVYQTVCVYRYETKATKPLIRGREFLWIEAHCAFETFEGSEAQVEEDVELAERVVWDELCIPFLVLERPEWDKFPGAETTFAFDTILPDGKILQVGTTHLLGQKFSKAFDIKFLDKDGKDKLVYQTCYGPGISRILAALVAVHGDEVGLIFPFDIAPLQVVIVPIFYSDEEKAVVLEKCERVEKVLKEKGISCLVDKSDRTPGDKFYYWERRGVPLRIEIGRKEVEASCVTVAKRDDRKRVTVKEEEIVEVIRSLAKELKDSLKKRAKEFFESRFSLANNREEIEKAFKERGGFVAISFCGRESCAREIKEELAVEVRGKVKKAVGVEIPSLSKVASNGRCAWCGSEAKETVLLAKAY